MENYLYHHIDELSGFIEKMDNFRNLYIADFSFDRVVQKLHITLTKKDKHDRYKVPITFDMLCQDVRQFHMENTKGFKINPILAVRIDGDFLYFQLQQGFISFQASSFHFKVPTTDKISNLNIEYVIQEFKNFQNMNIMTIRFDHEYVNYKIGYDLHSDTLYWASLLFDGKRIKFKTVEDLFEAKLYEGQSLRMRWSEVKIIDILEMSLHDWLSFVEHSVTTYVSVDRNEQLFVNGVKIDGYIDEQKKCCHCSKHLCYSIPYDTYFCPDCNRWEKGNQINFSSLLYFNNRPLEPALMWKPHKYIRFCKVQFNTNGKVYTYYCPDDRIIEGDWVQVPVSIQGVQKNAQVVKVFQQAANRPPYPLYKIRKVIGLSDPVWQHEPKTQLKSPPIQTFEICQKSLRPHDIVCDLTQKKASIVECKVCDVLKTPVVNFWLEYNDQPIKMTINTIYPQYDDKYFVEAIYKIKPYQLNSEKFKYLKLRTDINLKTARWIDDLWDEHQTGNHWQVDKYDIGIVAHPFDPDEFEVHSTKVGIPYYVEWLEEYQELYDFTVAWKYFVSDDDLSLWFQVG
ncbi:hypothetical protein [Staphylococcus sp. IVB6240]|uniref:hypothetical protein n=1 Tax=Staphylococcus sp. IVB6240 TaxID=2989771 RepID=UPI0021D024C4|nr:hypothetical protein [Staphylococcus sp. IVB6240]UXR70667.1 hypothetical protein MUA88_05400 [Staphylococcus sp. IVB6240]